MLWPKRRKIITRHVLRIDPERLVVASELVLSSLEQHDSKFTVLEPFYTRSVTKNL